MEHIKLVNPKSAEVYRYMNFDQIPAFVEQAATVEMKIDCHSRAIGNP